MRWLRYAGMVALAAAGLIVVAPILWFGSWVFFSGGHVAERFLTPEAVSSLDYLGGDKLFATCYISAYRTPSAEPPQLLDEYEAWSASNLAARLGDTGPDASYAAEFADDCWHRRMSRITGAPDFNTYLASAQPMMSFDWAENFALFDSKERLFIAVSP